MTTLIRRTTWFMAGGLTALHFWVTWEAIENALAAADKLNTVSIYTVVGVILFVAVVLLVCIVAGAVTIVRLSEAYYAMPKSHGGRNT